MSFDVTLLSTEIVRGLSRILTGKLLAPDQIQNISKNVVGKYFIDFLPSSKEEVEAEKRVEAARSHITEANRLISGLQTDLEEQAQRLNLIQKEILEKQELVNRYSTLAEAKQETVTAFKTEMEEAIRKELIAQSEKGKQLRRVLGILLWVVTLILGAFLGAYIQIKMEPFVKKPQPRQLIPPLLLLLLNEVICFILFSSPPITIR